MLWLPLAIGSYFLSALSSTIDKILLRERIPQPHVYAFYSGALSAGVISLFPFYALIHMFYGSSLAMIGRELLLPWHTIFLALIAGGFFVPALYFFYVALKRCDISRIIPIIGGAIPIMLIGFSYIANGTIPSLYHLFATILFIIGGFILAADVMCEGCKDTFGNHLLGVKGHRLQICGIDHGKGIFSALLAAFFFAATYFFSKLAYAAPSAFLPEFIWMRLGSFFVALSMLLIPYVRHHIHHSSRSMTKSSGGFLVGNKIIGASSFILLNKAIDLGPLVIINALKGFEYLFVFLFAIGFTIFHPSVLEEKFDTHTIILTLIAVTLMSFGLLFVASA